MSQPTKPVSLRGRRKFVEVMIENEQGVSQIWHLLELNAAGHEQYQNMLKERSSLDDSGQLSGLSRVDGFAMVLAGQNLVNPSDGTPFPPKRFQFELPQETVEALVDLAMELNGKKKSPEKDSASPEKPVSASPQTAANAIPKS